MHRLDEQPATTETWIARGRAIALTVLMISVFLFRFSYTEADVDLWGHIRYGLDLLQTGQIIRPDTYAYTSGNETWLNHEWLAEAMFASLYRLAGPPALIVVKVTVTLVLVGLIYAHLRRQGVLPLRAWILVLVGAIPLLIGLGTVRPQIFTYLAFLSLLLILHSADDGRDRWLWALTPLFALWVNLHGGFLAGLGLLLLWVTGHLSTSFMRDRRLRGLATRRNAAIILVTIISLAATLLNPYGFDLILFLLRTGTIPRPEITEWQPLAIVSIPGASYVVMVLLATAGFLRTTRRLSPPMVLLFIITALLPLVAIRHLPLFALAVFVVAGEHIGDAWQTLWPSLQEHGARWRLRLEAGLLVLFVVASLVLIAAAVPRFDCIHVKPALYPRQAIAILKNGGVRGNMVVEFDWGEYTLWHLGPDIQVSVDGRRETVYDDRILAKNLAFMFGLGDWNALLEDYDTDLALIRKEGAAYNLMKLQAGWLDAYEDDVSAVFAQSGSEAARKIAAAGLPADLGSECQCFP